MLNFHPSPHHPVVQCLVDSHSERWSGGSGNKHDTQGRGRSSGNCKKRPRPRGSCALIARPSFGRASGFRTRRWFRRLSRWMVSLPKGCELTTCGIRQNRLQTAHALLGSRLDSTPQPRLSMQGVRHAVPHHQRDFPRQGLLAGRRLDPLQSEQRRSLGSSRWTTGKVKCTRPRAAPSGGHRHFGDSLSEHSSAPGTRRGSS